MATKKKTEVTEEVKETTSAKKTTSTKKSTSTKKTTKSAEEVIEEFKAEPVKEVNEEPVAEVEVVGKKVAEVVVESEPVKEVKPAKKEEVKEADSYKVQVIAPSGIFTFKNPGLDQQKGRVYPKGSLLVVSEVKGNWAKVGDDKWILLSGAVVKI